MKTILSLYRATFRFDTLIADWWGSLMSLAIRFYVGWQFFKAGQAKLSNWEGTLALFQDEYQVPLLSPELAAYMGAGGELVLPVLLFAGVLTRPAALGLFCMNAMAVLSYKALFTLECPAALNDHFYWGFLLLALIGMGPGRASVDAFIGKRKMPA